MHLTRRSFIGAAAALASTAAESKRPNIVFVLLDDARADELHCTGHPFVKTPNIDRIAAQGVTFRNAFVTTPLCSPSRGSFFTGRYTHAHGVTDNTDHSPLSHQLVTFPMLLHRGGYETGFIGKWHMGVDDSPRPGFDHWVSIKGQGTYFNPDLNINGKIAHVNGYATDIFSDHALEYLGRKRTKPFLLCLSHKAVHPELTQNADGSVSDPNGGIFIPPDRYKKLYAGQSYKRHPNAGKPQGKPALQRNLPPLPPLSPATGTDDETIRNRARMLTAVDDGIGRMLAKLEAAGELDNTVFIFTSDEGYFFGEHGLSFERRLAYEESIRIPLLIRYPKLIKAGATVDAMALNIDIAPTILELAGVDRPSPMHGKSLLSLLKGDTKPWRDSFLIEYYSDNVFPRTRNMGYQAIRTGRWKLIRYKELTGMDELYDLQADPYEMRNLILDPASKPTARQLASQLDDLLEATPRESGTTP